MSFSMPECPFCGAAVQPLPGRSMVYCTQCGNQIALEKESSSGVKRMPLPPPVPVHPPVQRQITENFEAQRMEILKRYEQLTRLVIICISVLFLALCGMHFWLEAFGHVYSSWMVFVSVSFFLLLAFGITASVRLRTGKDRELRDLVRRQEEAHRRSYDE